ncbi:hypothetical protein ACFXOS_20115 [Streptomyces sp. NPDC059175]
MRTRRGPQAGGQVLGHALDEGEAEPFAAQGEEDAGLFVPVLDVADPS